MKLSKLLGLLFIGLTLLSSCKKDNTTPAGTLSVKLDGSTWSNTLATATILNGMTNISALGTNGDALTITLSAETAGTYTLSTTSAHASAYVLDQTGTSSAFTSNGSTSGGGRVVITEIDEANKTISGTFEFDVVRPTTQESHSFTEGVFSKIPYETTISGSGDNTLTAKIDGNAFTASAVSGLLFNNQIQVSAANSDNSQSIGLVIPENASTGTFSIGEPFFDDYSAQYNIGSTTFLSSTSGQIIITAHDVSNQRIEGTFSFSAEDFGQANQAEITEGTFSTSY